MKLTEAQIEKLSKIKTPWGEIGYITYKRTYARRLKENKKDSPTEEYIDTVLRVISACDKQLDCGFSAEEEEKLAKYLLELKGSVAGRFLWQLGTKTVDTLGLPSLQNCAFCIVNEPIVPFTWTMELLMLGSGVGYNIQKEFVYQIPKLRSEKIRVERIDDKSSDFIVPDTREGWVKILGKVLKAHFYTGKSFTYSCQLVRSEGEVIKSFGGTSSGPNVLSEGLDKINNVLNSRSGKKLRPIDCLDVLNIIGGIVVAGNVRRSAQLAIGDWDDIEFLKAKRWDLGQVPNWRAFSNNSIVPPQNLKDLTAEFWQTYEQGEPYGLINLELSKKCGRLGEEQYPDPDITGFNPCVTGETLLYTSLGEIPISELVDKEVNIWNGAGWSTVIPKKTGTDNSIFTVTFTSGQKINCTAYHVFYLKGKDVGVPSVSLKTGDKLQPYRLPGRKALCTRTVESVDACLSKEDVYCATESLRGRLVLNGVETGNCAEQGLNNKETCCLADIFLPNIKSKKELIEVATLLYRVCKHSLALPCHLEDTETVVHKNMRMGIGITGVLQASEDQLSWLDACYKHLREYDISYSKEKEFPISIKLTTVKPSGSLSLLPGVTPGAHPSPAGPYYIRRIRMATSSPLVQLCKQNGYDIEFVRGFDGKEDHTTSVVSFPCKVPEGTPIGSELGAIKHLEIVKKLQTNWSDNSVSCTIYYKKEELEEVRKWIEENFNDSLKTVSFLLYHGHGFDQAPYETITKERYEELMIKSKPITFIEVKEDDFEIQDCDNGSCPIK